MFSFAVLKIASIILSFLLTSTILFNSLRVSITYAYYYMDMTDFIERLCENKDAPELECNGKCHLKKVAQNNTNDDVPFKEISFKENTLFVVNQVYFNLVNTFKKSNQVIHYNNLYAYALNNSLDHPPQV